MDDAKEGKFDNIVVDKIDRFYRHLSGLLNALDQLNNYKLAFVSVQEQLDFTTPWGKLALSMLGMLAEIYLDNVRHETRKGKLQQVQDGMWNRNIPLGYYRGHAPGAMIKMVQATARMWASPTRAMGRSWCRILLTARQSRWRSI